MGGKEAHDGALLNALLVGAPESLVYWLEPARALAGLLLRVRHVASISGAIEVLNDRLDDGSTELVLVEQRLAKVAAGELSELQKSARALAVPLMLWSVADAADDSPSAGEHDPWEKATLGRLIAAFQGGSAASGVEVEPRSRVNVAGPAPEPSGVDDAEPQLGQLIQSVRTYARKVCHALPPGVRVDAENAAMVGLVEGLRHFGEMEAEHFARYLRARVRGGIWDEARRFDPLGRRTRQLVRDVERVTEQYRTKNGTAPDIDEVARILGVDEDRCWAALELSEYSTLPISDDTLTTGLYTAEDVFAEAYSAAALRWALSKLDARCRLVLRLWYKRGLPIAAIAKRLGVSTARAHQLRVKGERRLHALLLASPPLSEMEDGRFLTGWDVQTDEGRRETPKRDQNGAAVLESKTERR